MPRGRLTCCTPGYRRRRTRDASQRFDQATIHWHQETDLPSQSRAHPRRDSRRRHARVRREGLRRRARRFDRKLMPAPTSGCSTTTSATRRRSTSSCSRRPMPASAAPRRRSTSRTAIPRTGLRELALFTWRYFVEHPEFISLLNTENLMRARFLKGSKRIREMQTHLRRRADLDPRARRATGRLRAGARPAARLSDMASLSVFYLSNQYTLSVHLRP